MATSKTNKKTLRRLVKTYRTEIRTIETSIKNDPHSSLADYRTGKVHGLRFALGAIEHELTGN